MKPSWHWSNQPNAEEIRKKLSKSHKGQKPWNTGKHRDPNTLKKLAEGRDRWRRENPEEAHAIRKKASQWMIGVRNPRFGAKTSAMKGRRHTEDSIRKMSLAKIGRSPWNKGKKQAKTTGAKNPNWKGGVTSKNEQLRKSVEYKNWRRAVYERDNYTCQLCNKREEVTSRLNADHIKPWSLYTELRFNINNGRTLCIDCHKTTESYLNSRMKK